MKKQPLAMPLLIITLGLSPSAFAYLDPGSGSLILQMLIAGIMGALFTIKMYWYRLKTAVLRLLGKEPVESNDDDIDETTSDKK